MVDRATSGAIVVTGGAAVSLVGTFLPWLRSGARDRSSYTIFDLVERLGFAPDGVVSWSLRLWPLVPLVLVAVTSAAWMIVTGHLRWRGAVAVAAFAASWIGGTAVSIASAPDDGLFRIGPGPVVTAIGVVLVAAGFAALRRRGSGASAAA